MLTNAKCGPDCPIHPYAFTIDDTLQVTHHNLDKKEIKIALRLLGIMATSLLLIGLMVTWLGRSTSKIYLKDVIIILVQPR